METKKKRVRNAEKILSCNGKKIIRCAIVALVAVMSFTSCSEVEYESEMPYATQVKAAKAVINESIVCGILDAKGQDVYNEICSYPTPSLDRLVELIEECEQEDSFYDTVGEGDAWEYYRNVVLSQREQSVNND